MTGVDVGLRGKGGPAPQQPGQGAGPRYVRRLQERREQGKCKLNESQIEPNESHVWDGGLLLVDSI